MAVFLMVHGAWHGGWSFDPLRAGLEAKGHRLIAPDLAGTGDDAGLARTTLADWAEQIAELARGQLEKVILCGHSRGGIVISEAAQRAPEAIVALVYITGFMVPDGSSLADFAAPRTPELAAGLSLVADGAGVVVSADAAFASFYHRAPQAAARAAAARMVPEPTVIRSTVLELSEDRYGSLDRHYIECSDDRMIPLANQREMQRRSQVTSVATLDSDHCPFLCCPEALVAELDRIAQLYERQAQHG